MEWPELVPELTVLDFKASLSFYVDVLGFQIENYRENPSFAYLKFNKAHLLIEEYHSEGWNVGTMEYPLGAGINFQIECDDADALVRRLVNANVGLYRELKEAWYNTGDELTGLKEFLVQDPNGYLLRFSEYLGEKPLNKDNSR